ncbi:MAG: hypothetical protein RL347_123 [Actinomycetota bacterium]|jgi:SsrA-binding protein
MAREQGRKLIAQNHVESTVEAGLVLTGTEVKSLRAGRATLTDGYATIDNGEVWLRGVHIPEYDLGTWTNHEPRRARKLLLRRDEIRKMESKVKAKGFTLIPLAMYFKDGYAKVEIALATGRKSQDKRQAIAEREAKRETERAVGRRSKGMD